jgi:hypothetical protein
MYSLSIVAQDLGSPSNNALENVTIYVVDVYDDIIKFKKDLYEINITTSASRNDSLLNLTVSVPNSIFSLKGKIFTHQGCNKYYEAFPQKNEIFVTN